MRTTLHSCVVMLGAASLVLACSNSNAPQPARDPIAGQLNQNQEPVSHPTPQTPNDPTVTSGTSHGSRDPATNPTRESPTMSAGGPQQPLTEPTPQKPFYLGGADNGGNRVLAKTEKPLSDAEVLGVVLAANDGEVQMAEQAMKKAKSKDVKDFASMMKTHHGQGVTKTKSVATKTKLTTADSDLSTFLKNDTDKTIKDLKDKEGKDFDRAYIDAQLAAHKAVLAAIDNRLVPSAQSADVKSLVTETKKTVTDHISKAEEIQKKLESMASAFDGATSEPAASKAKTKTDKGLTVP